MFVLTELEDTIRIKPEKFHLKIVNAMRNLIDSKLANKVMPNVGLCIALRDILSVSESIILPDDGSSHTVVRFSYIVFRPLVGTLLQGKIRSCSREGVFVTLGFFDDIFIPADSLQHPSRFEETEQAWVWEYPIAENESHDLFMDIGEPIKFRIKTEIFEENSPHTTLQGDIHQSKPEPSSPYRIIGSVNESGLGLVSWWQFPAERQNCTASDEDEQ